MDIEKLKNKLVEVLNVSESEKSLSFQIFKKTIAESLKVNEAIKIDNLGTFQLKEKIGSVNELTLLFSPGDQSDSKESLFLNLDISDSDKNNNEFSENVFQIGINKRFIPVSDPTNISKENTTDEIENQIKDLVSNSTKLENFDLWEDYLKEKESTSILNDEEANNEVEEFFEDNISLDDDPLYNDDFEELNEDELFDDLVSNEKIIEEELDLDKSDQNDLSVDEEIIEKTELKEDDIITEINENVNENIIEEKLINDSDEIKSDEINIKETKIEEEITEETNVSEQENDDINEDNDKENITPIITDAPTKSSRLGDLDNEVQDIYKKRRFSKTKKSPIIYFLIGGFIAIGAIGIYYLFFKNPVWLYDKYEVETQLAEQHEKEFEQIKSNKKPINGKQENAGNEASKNEVKKSSLTEKQNKKVKEVESNNNKVKENAPKQTVNKKESFVKKSKSKTEPKQVSTNKLVKESNKVTKKITTPTKINNVKILPASNNEREAAKNIYFDGKDYTLQISSWKQSSIAVDQAKKILAKGYSAFVVKKFISKLNSTWYRVRVGPFSTLGKAKSIQRKLK